MRLLAGLFLAFLISVVFPVSSIAADLDQSTFYDGLDPRLSGHQVELLWRLQTAAGDYTSVDFNYIDTTDQVGFNGKISSYLNKAPPYGFNYKTNDFQFFAGLKIKEDWLGIIEGDSGVSNLQTSITLRGKAILKNKIELYQDVTLFRSDSTSYLDSASTTGEFLKDPLLSYQLPGRGPVASDVDLLELQVDRAFIKTNLYGVDIQTGRDRLQLKGGFRSGLIFSGLTRPVDMYYRFDYNVWRFCFTALSGQLTESGKRYISVKRATLRLARNLRIGATEAVAFYDDPSAYINPLMLFYIVHRHRPNNDDNLIASVDISFTPFKNLNLYLEFLDDDLIIFEGGASKYGFLAGLYKSQLFSERIDLRLEYSRVRKWTYTHVSDFNAWEYRGQPFGFWAGPDADELFIRLSCLLSPTSAVHVNFDYLRRGEGTWYLPHEEEGGDKLPPFPSGVVEKSTGGWIDIRHEFDRFIIRGRIGSRQIENRHNQPGDFDSYFTHWVVTFNL